MQNQEIIQIIENLKGRRDYEERKALKLGFTSLYSYFEDKLYKEKEKQKLKKKKQKKLKLIQYLKIQKKPVVVAKITLP